MSSTLNQPLCEPGHEPAHGAETHTAHPPGVHCLLDAYGCGGQFINSADRIERALRLAATSHGATVLEVVVKPFAPQGVTAVAVLAESHLSIHTWPELGYAAIDAFTCGQTDAAAICRTAARQLGAQSVSETNVRRGVPPAVNRSVVKGTT